MMHLLKLSPVCELLTTGGVLGAAVDAARIKDNIDTAYGRLGSIITEAARKHGLRSRQSNKTYVVNQDCQEH